MSSEDSLPDAYSVNASTRSRVTRVGSLREVDADNEHLGSAEYRNSLLFAIGWLDLISALDFPANVWNERPTPLFAQILEGLGGSIMLLGIFFSLKDLFLSWHNICFLRQERHNLRRLQVTTAAPARERVLKACLQLNKRELGWEIFDRLLLDLAMAISALCVGVGTLLAIRGDIDAVFTASNLLSGYLGNSFIALYACANVPWCVFMWNRGSRHARAVKTAPVDRDLAGRLMQQARQHQFYACVTGFTITISGVGSLLSAQLWYGYVVLIPGIIGSVFVNWFWRRKLGYNRRSLVRLLESTASGCDFHFQLRCIAAATNMLPDRRADRRSHQIDEEKDPYECNSQRFMHILGLEREFCEQVSHGACLARTPDFTDSTELFHDARQDAVPSHFFHVEDCSVDIHHDAVRQAIRSAGATYFRDLERFTMELYGNWLSIEPSPDSEMAEL